MPSLLVSCWNVRLSDPSLIGVGLLWLGLVASSAAVHAEGDAAAPGLLVFPEVVRLDGKDSRQQVLVTSTAPGERPRDLTRQASYRSSDPSVAVIGGDGVV